MTNYFIRRFSFIAGLLLVLCVAGCATLEPAQVRQQLQGKSVAVTSLLGPTLTLQLVGTTIFHNQYGKLSVPEWGLDEIATSVAISTMKGSGRLSSVSAFHGASRQKSDGSLTLPDGVQADFIIAIDSWSFRDFIFNTNEEIKGLGVFRRTFLGNIINKTVIFAGLQVSLHDGTGKLIGQHSSMNHQEAPFFLRSGGEIQWDWNGRNPSPFIEQTDMAALKELVSFLLKANIERNLDAIGLR